MSNHRKLNWQDKSADVESFVLSRLKLDHSYDVWLSLYPVMCDICFREKNIKNGKICRHISLNARWLITPHSLDGVLFWLICIVSSVQYFLIDNYAALARNLLSNPLVLISFLQDCVTSGQLESDMNKTFLKYEYHVIYSTSYGVPVLYFTASRQGNCDIFWCFIF